MWFKRDTKTASSSPPEQLTLRELIATQPRFLRGSLAPGDRFPSGMRPSRRRAQGMDLDSVGPYVPGDDVRWMDWRATARTGRAQMKRFVAESHLARMLIVDMRSHMFFATRGYPLAKAAALSAARFCWEAFSLQEPVGLIVVPGSEITQLRRGKNHVLQILGRLEESYNDLKNQREATTDQVFVQTLEIAASRVRPGDEIWVISDFGAPDQAFAEMAKNLSERFKLNAVIIEDAIFHQSIPSGHYPMRMADSASRQTANIVAKKAEEQAHIVEEMRRTQQRALIRSGWKTHRIIASDLLGRKP